MNSNLMIINVIVLVLVIKSHGGIIDSVYGTIKNTTTGLKQDVKNAWSFSKGLAGHDSTEKIKEEEIGFIGGIIHSAQEKMHSFHEFWVVEDIPNDSGLLWNMWCRLKQRLAKAKNYILGNDNKPIENNTEPPNEESIIIKDAMDKLFNADGTRKVAVNVFNEAVENLRKKLTEIRKKATTIAPVYYGEGLIDVRLAGKHEDLKDNSKDATGIDNDIYDKVYDSMNAANNLDKVQDGVIGLKDKVSDEVAKEKDLLVMTYNKLDEDTKNVADSVKESAGDMTRLAYP